jgi:hypothetical protein
VQAIGERWRDLAAQMARGEAHPTISIGRPDEWPTLAPLLASRASLLLEWAADESTWEGDQQ